MQLVLRIKWITNHNGITKEYIPTIDSQIAIAIL